MKITLNNGCTFETDLKTFQLYLSTQTIINLNYSNGYKLRSLRYTLQFENKYWGKRRIDVYDGLKGDLR